MCWTEQYFLRLVDVILIFLFDFGSTVRLLMLLAARFCLVLVKMGEVFLLLLIWGGRGG